MSTNLQQWCASVRTILLRELAELYIAERRRPVNATDQDNIRRAVAFYLELFPDANTANFGGERMEKFLAFMVKKPNKIGRPYARSYINKLANFLKGIVRWGVRKKLVSAQFAFEISLIPPLEYGEALHENPDREEASPEAIKATILKLLELGDRLSADILILLVLTGARPGELLTATAGEIKRKTGKSWIFVPFHHKTKWKGKKREITLGEEEQKILEKYLAGKKDGDFLFCNQSRYKDKPISPRRYSDILKKTQKQYGLEKFTPYQVRHTNGTWIGDVLDIDHARAQLGHSSTATTKRYVHVDTQKQQAVLAMRKAVGSAIGDVFDLIDPPSVASYHPHIIKFPSIPYTRK